MIQISIHEKKKKKEIRLQYVLQIYGIFSP